MIRTRWCLGAALVAMATLAPRADAQERDYPRWYLGGALEYGNATGDAETYIQDGGGLSAYASVRLGRTSPFALRMSGNVLIYGSQTDTYTVVPGVDVDVTTTKTFAGFGLGPQYVVGGRGVEATVFATVGGTYIATTSSLSGGSSDVTTQLDDIAWAGEAGGGLLIHLSRVLALDVGARYRHTGEISYLPRDWVPTTGGQVPTPITGEVGVAFVYVGLAVKLGGVRPPREDATAPEDGKQGIR
jgi:hypothetical protein